MPTSRKWAAVRGVSIQGCKGRMPCSPGASRWQCPARNGACWRPGNTSKGRAALSWVGAAFGRVRLPEPGANTPQPSRLAHLRCCPQLSDAGAKGGTRPEKGREEVAGGFTSIMTAARVFGKLCHSPRQSRWRGHVFLLLMSTPQPPEEPALHPVKR